MGTCFLQDIHRLIVVVLKGPFLNQPIEIAGQRVCPGDWIVADDDGVMVLPRDRAVEMANRAADVLEQENRIRREIRDNKSTLAKVLNLARWEQKGTGPDVG